MDNTYKKLLLLSDVHKKVNHWNHVPELDNPDYISCFLGDLASGCVGTVRNNIRNVRERVDYQVEGNHDRAVYDAEHRKEEFCSNIGELRNSGNAKDIEMAMKLEGYYRESRNLEENLDPEELSFLKNSPRILELNNYGETVVCVHDTYAPKELIEEFISHSSDPTRILDKERAQFNFDWMECGNNAKYLALGHGHMPFIASRKMSSARDGHIDFRRILDRWHMKGVKKIRVDDRTMKYVIPLKDDRRYIIGDGSLSSIKNYVPDKGILKRYVSKSLISYAILDIAEKKAEFVIKNVA